jgi:hypothetical protein
VKKRWQKNDIQEIDNVLNSPITVGSGQKERGQLDTVTDNLMPGNSLVKKKQLDYKNAKKQLT